MARSSLAMMLVCGPFLAGCADTKIKPVTDWQGIDPITTHSSRLYFGGQPSPVALKEAKNRGIEWIINLRSEQEMQELDFDEAALVEQLGMQYVSIPITGSTFGPAHARELEKVMPAGKHVLIHCASSNRVGALWAMYCNHYGSHTIQEAIVEGRAAGLRSEKLTRIVREHAINP